MQWPVLRRALPWRTALLMCSIPALALAVLLAWFRWELPPLERYYLMAYWDCSRHAENPESTIQIEWLYITAPGRKSQIAIPLDVDSNAAGFLPVGLSSSAREGGWNDLVKVPAQRWKSSELESFLQEDFYDHRTFGEVIAEPLSFICVIPLLVLCVAVMIRQELVCEWRRLYEEMYGVEFASDWTALWWKFSERLQDWKGHLLAGAKARLSRRQLEPEGKSFAAANQRSFLPEGGPPLSGAKPVVPVVSSAGSTRYMIFPGAAAIRNGNAPPKPWDESQWID